MGWAGCSVPQDGELQGTLEKRQRKHNGGVENGLELMGHQSTGGCCPAG